MLIRLGHWGGGFLLPQYRLPSALAALLRGPPWYQKSALCIACAVIASLPAAAVAREPVVSLLEMRRANVVIQQWDISCGAAALATVLNYQFEDPVSEREIAGQLIRREEYMADPRIVRARMGFSLLDLKNYVDAHGYSGAGYGQLDLGRLVEMAPVIVPVELLGFRHFVVFRGMRGNRVLLADPAFGNRTMPTDRFEAAWIDDAELGRIGFVVTRPGEREHAHRLAPQESDFVMLH